MGTTESKTDYGKARNLVLEIEKTEKRLRELKSNILVALPDYRHDSPYYIWENNKRRDINTGKRLTLIPCYLPLDVVCLILQYRPYLCKLSLMVCKQTRAYTLNNIYENYMLNISSILNEERYLYILNISLFNQEDVVGLYTGNRFIINSRRFTMDGLEKNRNTVPYPSLEEINQLILAECKKLDINPDKSKISKILSDTLYDHKSYFKKEEYMYYVNLCLKDIGMAVNSVGKFNKISSPSDYKFSKDSVNIIESYLVKHYSLKEGNGEYIFR